MKRTVIGVVLLLASSAFAAPSQIGLRSVGSGSLPPAGLAPPVEDGRYALSPADHEVDLRAYLSAGPGSPSQLPTTVPEARSSGLSLINPGFSGFSGLDHYANRFASGGNQFSSEPPDQGLCAGNGFVLETVNSVYALYNEAGDLLAGPVAANAFFGLPPAIDRTALVFGPDPTDPKCIYDWTENRWYITTLVLFTEPSSGAFTGETAVFIARSRSGNPAASWDFFSIDTTNDGRAGVTHNGCPCLGDQPLLGFDENAIFITTNEYSWFEPIFNGAQVYAIGKRAFTGGGSIQYFENVVLEGNTSYSLQPASTPPGGRFSRARGGTEFFASALDFVGPLDDRVAIWALTGTRSLNTPHPAVSLSYRLAKTRTYGLPPPATQKDGPRPLGDLLGEPVEKLETNDDRMNQAVYTEGQLWSALNTVVKPKGDSGYRAGILWFRAEVEVDDKGLKAKIKDDGYITRPGMDVMFPAVAVNARGQGAIGFSLSGPDLYPSTGYVLLDDDGTGPIHIANAGPFPEDGFSGYVAYGFDGIARWGDYSAAVAGQDGSIWMAAETTSTRRSSLANWGTFVSRVKLGRHDD